MHGHMGRFYAPPSAGVRSMIQSSWSCWTPPRASPSSTWRSSLVHQPRLRSLLRPRRLSERPSEGNSAARWTPRVPRKVWKSWPKPRRGGARQIFQETRTSTSCWASPRAWWWKPPEESWCSQRTPTPTSCRPLTGEWRDTWCTHTHTRTHGDRAAVLLCVYVGIMRNISFSSWSRQCVFHLWSGVPPRARTEKNQEAWKLGRNLLGRMSHCHLHSD